MCDELTDLQSESAEWEGADLVGAEFENRPAGSERPRWQFSAYGSRSTPRDPNFQRIASLSVEPGGFDSEDLGVLFTQAEFQDARPVVGESRRRDLDLDALVVARLASRLGVVSPVEALLVGALLAAGEALLPHG